MFLAETATLVFTKIHHLISDPISKGTKQRKFLFRNLRSKTSKNCYAFATTVGKFTVPKIATTSSSWMTSNDPDTTKQRASTLSPAW